MAIGDMPNACLSFMNQTGPGRFRGFGAFRRLNARQVRLGRGELGDFHGVRFSKLGHRKTHDGHPRACAPIHRSRGTAIGLNTDVAGPSYGDRAAVLVCEKSFQSIPANRTVRDTLESGGGARSGPDTGGREARPGGPDDRSGIRVRATRRCWASSAHGSWPARIAPPPLSGPTRSAARGPRLACAEPAFRIATG